MCLIRFNKGWPKLSRNFNLRIGHESLPSSGALRRQSQKDSAEPPQAGDFSQVQSGGFRWPISRNLVALRWEFGCWKIHSCQDDPRVIPRGGRDWGYMRSCSHTHPWHHLQLRCRFGKWNGNTILDFWYLHFKSKKHATVLYSPHMPAAVWQILQEMGYSGTSGYSARFLARPLAVRCGTGYCFCTELRPTISIDAINFFHDCM